MKLQLYKLLYPLLQRSSTDNMYIIMKFVIFKEKVLQAKIPFATQFWRIIVVCILIYTVDFKTFCQLFERGHH